jgi:hypothetical protein
MPALECPWAISESTCRSRSLSKAFAGLAPQRWSHSKDKLFSKMAEHNYHVFVHTDILPRYFPLVATVSADGAGSEEPR